MAQEPRDLVLEHLRRMDRKFDAMAEDIGSIKHRMSAMERHMLGQVASDYGQNDEIDRLKRRVDRIERRLELVDEKD